VANVKLKEFLPENPYSFFNYGDTNFKGAILNELKGIEKTFKFFSIIAIIIACMGIFGLVALTVKNKTKEIGIRKVLGSSAIEIFGLITREYLVLAILGNALAWYPAWYFSKKMIQDFAYHIEISIWVFVFAFAVSIILTILTITFHTIKAARTNPVEALRYE
jgi:putative ABC transport system permease protein